MYVDDCDNDEERKAKWRGITDPLDALQALNVHSEYLGSDPYYRDLHNELMSMIVRVLHLHKRPVDF